MLIFEILATIAALGVMIGITWTMIGMMDWLDKNGWHFIPSAWLTTAWGIGTSIGGAIFIIDILKGMFA
jgi:hypothetical protein